MVKRNAKEGNFKALGRLVDEIFEKHRDLLRRRMMMTKKNAGI